MTNEDVSKAAAISSIRLAYQLTQLTQSCDQSQLPSSQCGIFKLPTARQDDS